MNKFKLFVFSIILYFMFLSNCSAYYEAPVDITKLDIYEINDAIDDGFLTYEALIRLYLDRINTYNEDYNAIISINEKAIEEAKKCDKIYKKKGRSSPLFCIPIIVKDNIDVKTMATTVGTKSLNDSFPKKDANVISKLKNKGMIILAKSNMSEFAFRAEDSTSSYGTVKNAYNLNYSSYGSSGGSAVSVALSFAPAALGTDTNSSLRAPAAANNVVGFRSTFNLIDTTGIVAYDITRDVVGPITKTVKENALILETMASTTEKYSDLNNSTLKNKNIIVLDQFAYGDDNFTVSGTDPTSKEVKRLFNKALKKMENNGANIIHLKKFYTEEYYNTYKETLAGFTMCHAFEKYITNTSSSIKSFKELTYSKGHIYELDDYLKDCSRSLKELEDEEELKDNYNKYIISILDKYNSSILVYPTVKNKLSKLEEDNFSSASYSIAPILGYPAVSIPLGFDDNNLPYGIEFVSTKNNEKELYNTIKAFENINNTSKKTSNAPSLYKIPKEVENLKELYISNKNKLLIKEKKKVLKEIKEFFLNYNNYKDKSSAAKKLYKKYNNIKSHNIQFTIAIISLLLIITGLIIRIKRRK